MIHAEELRIREIIKEELDKRIVCGYMHRNITNEATYFPIGVIMTKDELERWKSEHFGKTAVRTN